MVVRIPLYNLVRAGIFDRIIRSQLCSGIFPDDPSRPSCALTGGMLPYALVDRAFGQQRKRSVCHDCLTVCLLGFDSELKCFLSGLVPIITSWWADQDCRSSYRLPKVSKHGNIERLSVSLSFS